MHPIRTIRRTLIALGTAGLASTAAHAGPGFSHPAVATAAVTAATLTDQTHAALVGHPASPQWRHVRANGTHPAVAVYERAQRAAGVDANTFVVLPPSSVRWTAAEPQLNLASSPAQTLR